MTPDFLADGYDEGREDENPVTAAGLDRFFRQCSQLERLSLHCLTFVDLPASFFQLLHLRALDLTDDSALEYPDFANFSSLANLSLVTSARNGCSLTKLVEFSGLTSLSFRNETRLSLGEERYHFQRSPDPDAAPFSFALLSSLKSLRFDTTHSSSPPFGLMFPSGSLCRNLERPLLTQYDGLERLPHEIGELLPCLPELSIASCEKFSELPEQLTSLICLQSLKISSCNVLSLPENFGELPVLKTLVLHKLPIVGLPDSFRQLTSLETFFIIECAEMEKLPAGFASLTSLKSLCLETEELQLPDDFRGLASLQTLFRSKKFSQQLLPYSFTRLSSLTRLELNVCMISEPPEGMTAMGSLQQLYIHHCLHITEIPGSITVLPRPEILRIKGCSSLLSVPRSLVSLGRLKELEISKCELLLQLPESLPTTLQFLSLGDD
ncbi:hypothetical protein CLOM_g2019 [Closterium sp. NIES-68]|nr:hypothetical protein CLOM_g2019 [Closterium sp. NIES-68]GJP62628.1 hypothetical protein CLOP_g19665 [Closterium sp. NIES-67]